MARQLSGEDIRQVLRRAEAYLDEDMTPDNLQHMLDKGLITENDHKEILEGQNRIFLRKMLEQEKAGRRGYDQFKKCLTDFNYVHCVEVLEKKEGEILTGSLGLQKTEVVPLSPDEKASVTKCLHDGRLLEMKQAHIINLKSSCSKPPISGGFGNVFICDGQVIGVNNIQFALKEITVPEKDEELATRSIANEKIASRLMHFAIVPLIAYFDDSGMNLSYFLSPYLSMGSLFDALKCIRSKEDTKLSEHRNRLKVLLHIASAIAYIHSEVKNFRGPVLHMDIKSDNIVLDGECNARLVDFGFARELKEGSTSIKTKVYNFNDAYCPIDFSMKPTMHHDVYRFGVVIREVVTALPPKPLLGEPSKLYLLKMSKFQKNISEFLLKPIRVANDIWNISEECIRDEFSPSKTIYKNLWSIHRQHMGNLDRWSPAKMQPPKCEICLVNPFEEVGCWYLKHSSTCREPIKVCIACMRNSYFNPIKCHSCKKEKIDPFIGEGWGAVFVAGYDSNPEVARAFKKDVDDMRSCMTSVSLPVMCISEEKTAVIEPNSGGNTTPENKCLDKQTTIEAALRNIMAHDITTMVFYYSGHHRKEGFHLNDKTTMQIDEIGNTISDIFNERQMTKEGEENYVRTLRVILFLDCCMPRELEVKNNPNIKVIQFNACADTEETTVKKKESIFTKYVIQAFTKKASLKQCLSETCRNHKECGIEGHFVRMDALLEYVNSHIPDNVQVATKGGLKAKDIIIGYNYDFKIEFSFTPYHFGVRGQKRNLKTVTLSPEDFETMEELKKKLAPSFDDVLPADLTLKKIIPDLLSIEISMGPRNSQKEEVCTIRQLIAVWNGKRRLEVLQRRIDDIAPDKPVGVVVQNVESLRNDLISWVKENKLKALISGQVDDMSSETFTSLTVDGEDVEKLLTCRGSIEATSPIDTEAFFKAIEEIRQIQPDRRWTRVVLKFHKDKDNHWQPIVILQVELGE